jgi:hypothetical protein
VVVCMLLSFLKDIYTPSSSLSNSLPLPLPPSLSLSLSLSLSHALHTHTHTHTQAQAHTHTYTHTLTRVQEYSQVRTHIMSASSTQRMYSHLLWNVHVVSRTEADSCLMSVLSLEQLQSLRRRKHVTCKSSAYSTCRFHTSAYVLHFFAL